MIPLIDAQNGDDAVMGAAFRHASGLFRGDGHGLLIEREVRFALLYRRQHEREIRIIGHEGFGKDDKIGTIARGLVDGVEDPCEGLVTTGQIGCDLDGGRLDDAGHETSENWGRGLWRPRRAAIRASRYRR